MKNQLIHFQKNNNIKKKIVVTLIWIFSLLTIALLFAIAYQELIYGQITNQSDVVGTLLEVTIGIFLIGGLLLSSKTARWIILLIAYITFLSPFVKYIMFKLFVPEMDNSFLTSPIVLNIIMSIAIITLLNNGIVLKLFSLKKDKRLRIKEQVYFLGLAIFLISIYVYYIYIPILYKNSLLATI